MTDKKEEQEIDYVRLAIDNIVCYYECSICEYTASKREYVVLHIINKHSMEELKEICSQ